MDLQLCVCRYLYPVVWCDLPLNVLYPSSGKLS
ncbi:hypothetical protein Taro_026643, partial [Colocasia esculenta]|nr:hypothetical protein [Colocasia esculenta]